MARKAIILTATGLVVNIIELKSGTPYSVPPGHSLRNGAGASPGDTWDGSNFITPAHEPPDPGVVRRGELEARLLAGPVSVVILQEYVVNRHNIEAPDESAA